MATGRSDFLGFLREASWLTADRARAYVRILAVLAAAGGFLWIISGHDDRDAAGQPIGTDFLSFWAASKLAQDGTPALAYDVTHHAAAERAAMNGADPGYYAFFYPPLFLLICWPLALLPYGASLAAWIGVTGLAYWRVIARFGQGRLSNLPILAFPAVLSNIGHGQNAFLSTALFGGAILARRRPLLAGLLFGALAFKPHLGLLIPVFLITSGSWIAILAAAGTVLVGAVLSILAFGPAIWPAFLATTPLARRTLENGLVGAEKMQSVFAAVQLWHGPIWLGYCAQALVAALACAVLIILVRTRPGSDAGGPALVAATLLASPFLLDYDLTLMAIPLVWVFSRACDTGFWSYEKVILLAGFVLPLTSRAVAGYTGIPLGPAVVGAVLFIVLRRGLAVAPDRVASTDFEAPVALTR